jgi:hypothetical protein
MNEPPQAPPPDTTPIEFEKIASTERQTVAKLQAEAEVKAADAQKKRVEAEAILKELMLKEQELVLKAQDMQLREKEVGIAERGADREDFTALAAVEHKGAEIGLNARKTDADIVLSEKKLATDAQRGEKEVGLSEKKLKIDAKKSGVDPDGSKKRKTVTRVTKHDDKGRIVEFEQEDSD